MEVLNALVLICGVIGWDDIEFQDSKHTTLLFFFQCSTAKYQSSSSTSRERSSPVQKKVIITISNTSFTICGKYYLSLSSIHAIDLQRNWSCNTANYLVLVAKRKMTASVLLYLRNRWIFFNKVFRDFTKYVQVSAQDDLIWLRYEQKTATPRK